MPGAIPFPHPGESPLHLESPPLLPVGRRTLSVAHSLPLGTGGERASQEGLPWWLSSKESTCNVGDLGWEDALEEGMATHSSILPWRIPGTEEPGGLQSIG